MAMRMPISRVRSVTDTSMMFMMPMPPTMSDTPAMPASRFVIVSTVAVLMSAISCWVRIVKSSGSPATSLCCVLMMTAIASATSLTASALAAET